ncbi:family 43 glycosylhydrolase [Ohtaekwangia koreensis]|nr:family 43 glycosylhydrolase [Ohtaekwangia koreensis]
MGLIEPLSAQKNKAHNSLIFADVPDISLMRVGKNYYMNSTTTSVNPGVPMMKSTDLVNWKLINYSYDTLADLPALNLSEGKNIYSRGSWASSLRYYKGMISI